MLQYREYQRVQEAALGHFIYYNPRSDNTNTSAPAKHKVVIGQEIPHQILVFFILFLGRFPNCPGLATMSPILEEQEGKKWLLK